MFQAALTIHDIDADSARGTSIITDHRSSCRFSDDEEVSECVYEYHNAAIVSAKSMQMCKSMQIMLNFVLWSLL